MFSKRSGTEISMIAVHFSFSISNNFLLSRWGEEKGRRISWEEEREARKKEKKETWGVIKCFPGGFGGTSRWPTTAILGVARDAGRRNNGRARCADAFACIASIIVHQWATSQRNKSQLKLSARSQRNHGDRQIVAFLPHQFWDSSELHQNHTLMKHTNEFNRVQTELTTPH